jgi:phosphohistidine phosphatase
MIVYFFRHANAGQKKVNPTLDDKRPLNSEGIEQCLYIGKLLSAIDAHVDLVISSPLKRATQSAALVGNEIGYELGLQPESAMKPAASFEQFQEVLRTFGKGDALMVVGHNPSISHYLSSLLTRGASDKAIQMKRGSVARLEISTNKAVLNWFVTPKIAQTILLSPSRVPHEAASKKRAQSQNVVTKMTKPALTRKPGRVKGTKQKPE